MKIFNRNYVGINHERDDVKSAPLAFLTPYEDNAAGKKRRDTVDDWANGGHWRNEDRKDPEFKIIDNKPKHGFKIVDYADRWATSNKFARVYDPDGFELEISMANLIDLMLYSVVDHGEIKEELIWARDGAQNRLIPVGSDLYKYSLQEGQKLTANVGDKVIGAHNVEYVYLGLGYIQPVALVGREIEEKRGDGHWLFNNGITYKIIPDRVTTKTATGKPEHVYLYVGENRWGNQECSFNTRKNPMKITANFGPSNLVWGDHDIGDMPYGFYFTADGEFAGARRIGYGHDDPHRHYGRKGLFRAEPFDDTELDFSKLEPLLKDDE